MKNKINLFVIFVLIFMVNINGATAQLEKQPQKNESKNFVSAYSKKEIPLETILNRPVDIAFDNNDSIQGWIHTLGSVPFEGSKQFIPKINRTYKVRIDGYLRNNNKINGINEPTTVELDTVVNRIKVSVGKYSLILSPNETKEFSHSFDINLKKDDIMKFQMSGKGSMLIPKQVSSNQNSSLKTGESIHIIIKPEISSLRNLSVHAIAEKINTGKLTLAEAKKLLPHDLHEELEAAIKKQIKN